MRGGGAAAASCLPPANSPLFPSMDLSWGVVVEVGAVAGSAALLVGRRNSLMSEFRRSSYFTGSARLPGGAAKPVALGVRITPSDTRGMGNLAAVKRF